MADNERTLLFGVLGMVAIVAIVGIIVIIPKNTNSHALMGEAAFWPEELEGSSSDCMDVVINGEFKGCDSRLCTGTCLVDSSRPIGERCYCRTLSSSGCEERRKSGTTWLYECIDAGCSNLGGECKYTGTGCNCVIVSLD